MSPIPPCPLKKHRAGVWLTAHPLLAHPLASARRLACPIPNPPCSFPLYLTCPALPSAVDATTQLIKPPSRPHPPVWILSEISSSVVFLFSLHFSHSPSPLPSSLHRLRAPFRSRPQPRFSSIQQAPDAARRTSPPLASVALRSSITTRSLFA